MQYPPAKFLTSLLSGKAGATLWSKPFIFHNLLHQKKQRKISSRSGCVSSRYGKMVTWQYQGRKNGWLSQAWNSNWKMGFQEPWDPQKSCDAARTGYFTENLPLGSLNQSTLFHIPEFEGLGYPQKKYKHKHSEQKKCSKLNSHSV